MSLKVTTGILPEWYSRKPKEWQEASESDPAFFLRPLNGPEQLIAQDECYDNEKKRITGRGYVKILGYGLVKWKHVVDENGNEIEYKGPADIALLPFDLISELACKVISMSTFRGDDAKN